MLYIPEEMVSVIFLKIGFTLILDPSTVDHPLRQRQLCPSVMLLEVDFLSFFSFNVGHLMALRSSCLGSSMPSATSLMSFCLPTNIHELLRSSFSSTEGQREQGWNRGCLHLLPNKLHHSSPSPNSTRYSRRSSACQNLYTVSGQHPKFREYKSRSAKSLITLFSEDHRTTFKFCNLTNIHPGNEIPSSIS